MSEQGGAIKQLRLRAPLEHSQALLQPDLSCVGELLMENQQRRTLPAAAWLTSLVAEARPAFIMAAVQHTAQYRDVAQHFSALSTMLAPRILLSGHQPELFHAGVWFKNFVLSSLANTHGALGINLIIDNDTLRTPSIRVPGGDLQQPILEHVAFDAVAEVIPYEERLLGDSACFDTFPDRVQAIAVQWLHDPLLPEVWRKAQFARRRTTRIGEILSEARHVVEGTWGLNTLELPLSTVVSHVTFQRFVVRLLSDIMRFRQVHNDCLREYRLVNHIRSRAHPVPDLVQEGEWHEAPLWIWSRTQPYRRRLFVRCLPNRLELTDRASISFVIPTQREDDALAWEAFAALERRGVKLRPRALLTTLYARLVLSDLFIHGIGGAKYDELTDAIVRRYYQFEPPHFLTATATLKLPIHYPWVGHNELEASERALRELEFHPEKFLANHPLIEKKRELIANIPSPPDKKMWHIELQRVNAQLHDSLREIVAHREAELSSLLDRYRWSRWLDSREFFYGLFPADMLREKLNALAR